MKVNFLKTNKDTLHFEIVTKSGNTYYFKMCVHSSHSYNFNSLDISCPKYVKNQAIRVFTRYLNWLLIGDSLKANLNGHRVNFIRQDQIFSFWNYKIYGDIDTIVNYLNSNTK